MGVVDSYVQTCVYGMGGSVEKDACLLLAHVYVCTYQTVLNDARTSKVVYGRPHRQANPMVHFWERLYMSVLGWMVDQGSRHVQGQQEEEPEAPAPCVVRRGEGRRPAVMVVAAQGCGLRRRASSHSCCLGCFC